MVILITGASHCGKTYLAQKMLERAGIPYFSIDHLKMGLIRSGYTGLTPEDDDELISYLWPIVREMMKTAIENEQHLIIEGCYVPFAWRNDFNERYLSDIRFLCLSMTEKYIDEHFSDIRHFASAIENRLDDPDLSVARLKEDNRKYAKGFSDAGESILLIDNDFEETIGSAVEFYCK